MPATKLKAFLDSNNVRYVTIGHSVAYTAQEVAAITHTRGRELAKTVIVKIDDEFAMAVVPASRHVDLDRLGQAVGDRTVQLATEAEFKSRFPDCETGAMPPFGNLYDMRVIIDETLAADEEIAFNSGTHRELIRMSYADFERLVRPQKLTFSAGPYKSARAY
jgi:Ala-tRNA(Pro) deacylase